jgi:hypothetical protein
MGSDFVRSVSWSYQKTGELDVKYLAVILFFLCVCAPTKELIIEKKQFADVRDHVLLDSKVLSIDTLPQGMMKIRYRPNRIE